MEGKGGRPQFEVEILGDGFVEVDVRPVRSNLARLVHTVSRRRRSGASLGQ